MQVYDQFASKIYIMQQECRILLSILNIKSISLVNEKVQFVIIYTLFNKRIIYDVTIWKKN